VLCPRLQRSITLLGCAGKWRGHATTEGARPSLQNQSPIKGIRQANLPQVSDSRQPRKFAADAFDMFLSRKYRSLDEASV
jgi:hypothetical protein